MSRPGWTRKTARMSLLARDHSALEAASGSAGHKTRSGSLTEVRKLWGTDLRREVLC